MINTDRQVDADQDGRTAWRQMLIKTCDPEYWAEMETTRIAMVGQDQEVINLN